MNGQPQAFFEAAFAAVSREDFGIVCGDINEKQQKNMVDRLRGAAHGAGHWRYWELQSKGEGDHIVHTETVERQASWLDAEYRQVYCKPHYMHGGVFLPSSQESLEAIQRTLAAVAGPAADLAAWLSSRGLSRGFASLRIRTRLCMGVVVVV